MILRMLQRMLRVSCVPKRSLHTGSGSQCLVIPRSPPSLSGGPSTSTGSFQQSLFSQTWTPHRESVWLQMSSKKSTKNLQNSPETCQVQWKKTSFTYLRNSADAIHCTKYSGVTWGYTLLWANHQNTAWSIKTTTTSPHYSEILVPPKRLLQ